MDLSTIAWGDDSAEKDSYLLAYFVGAESYNRLLRKDKSIVIGRKGSGKSAPRKKLESEFSAENSTHVVNISPKYSSIINILNDKQLSDNFAEEMFFQHTWLRQIMLDCLCHAGHSAKGKYSSESLEFGRQVSVELNRTSKDMVENISEIMSRLKLKAGNLGELGMTLEKELRNVAETDALGHHLKEIANSGGKFVVLVDDLDLDWDNSDTSNSLLLGLLSASSHIMGISTNIHVIVMLREDVYAILMGKTQHSDKYRNVEKIRWSKDGLIALLESRIKFNLEQEGEDARTTPFLHVFPATVGTHNTDNWLIERTLSRPRELIQLARFYTEGVPGQDPDDEALKAC